MNHKVLNGLLALSPLAVFLLVYLVSSIIEGDFYTVPVSAAFLIASIYSIIICKKNNLREKLDLFSSGAGNPNVLLMIWIFVLAGAFASTAKDIGAIDATVHLTMRLLPGSMLYAGLFLVSCFISMSIGTSVGTVVALLPIAAGIAEQTGAGLAFMAGIIVGGAFFGDNLSFISDTTIAATRATGCSMRDKFKANLLIVLPAVIVVTGIYLVQGQGVSAFHEDTSVNWVRIIPYILVLTMAISGINVAAVLTMGILLSGGIGLIYGDFSWSGLLASIGSGIAGMAELIIVTLLAGGMMEVIRHNGGLEFIVDSLASRSSGKRSAEYSIAALVGLSNLCTANNTISILTVGGIANDLTKKFGLDPRKTASILDTFSCLVQGLIPYGAQLLMASSLTGVAGVEIIKYLYYPLALGVVSIIAIAIRYPRKYS